MNTAFPKTVAVVESLPVTAHAVMIQTDLAG